MITSIPQRPRRDRRQATPARILVILGHPDRDSFCGAIATTYCQSAQAAGAAVRTLDLGSLQFDPVLRHGYRQMQDLEPDLLQAQTDILWANHLVFVYPNWWGSMPAVMKGFFDRTLLPGFAFKYHTRDSFWDRLLTGRSAHLIVTMDTPAWYYRWFFKSPGHNQMKRTVLEFCGITPIQLTEIAPVRNSTPEQRSRWLAQVGRLAEKATRRQESGVRR